MSFARHNLQTWRRTVLTPVGRTCDYRPIRQNICQVQICLYTHYSVTSSNIKLIPGAMGLGSAQVLQNAFLAATHFPGSSSCTTSTTEQNYQLVFITAFKPTLTDLKLLEHGWCMEQQAVRSNKTQDDRYGQANRGQRHKPRYWRYLLQLCYKLVHVERSGKLFLLVVVAVKVSAECILIANN
jgi:hypothetical protein